MKKVLCGLLILMLVLSISIPAAAQTLPLVVDYAGLLTADEDASLTEALEHIRQEYGADIVVLTVQSLEGKTAESYADDYYDENGYCEDGALLLVAMDDRQWHISTSGRCIEKIDTYEIAGYFLSDLSDGRYYDAFLTFGLCCEKAVYIQQDGEPVITGSDETEQLTVGEKLFACIVIGLVVGLIVVLVMKRKLKSVRQQHYAGNYLVEDLVLTRSTDRFLYQTTTSRPLPKDNDTHISSSGKTHGGGGGRF